MLVSINLFEKTAEKDVFVCHMENDNGMTVEILSFGGTIRSISVPGRNNAFADVVLGHEKMAGGYSTPYGYGAALIGRFANRIKGGVFETEEGKWILEKNDGDNTLHGASGGYGSKHFNMTSSHLGDRVQCILKLIDIGEGGFPGSVEIKAVYTLYAHNELEIAYSAVPDHDTVINLTNHAFFNLAGHGCGSVERQKLRIASDFYTPNDENCVPTGEVLSVKGTVFDFTEFRALGDGFASGDKQIEMFRGYDHNLCLRGRNYRQVMEAIDPDSGRCMIVHTDLPGVQLYTTNNEIPAEVEFKEGAHYSIHQAFCFETQFFPDSAG